MFPAARILAVDDDQNHLSILETQIKRCGSSCLSVCFTGIGSLPTEPLKNVRLVFMDINLLVGAPTAEKAEKFTVIQAILDHVIPDDNGPYALITWTSTADHAELIQYLKTRLTVQKRPFFSSSLDKNVYGADAERLLQALQALHNQSPQMAALLDWERRVQDAGSQVLNDLLRVSAVGPDPDLSVNIDNFMSWLARAAHGKDHAVEDKLSAVNDALSPVLHDKIAHICSETIPNRLWDVAVTKIATATPLTDPQAGLINSALHISKHVDRVLPSHRGAIVVVPADWLTDANFEARFQTEKAVMIRNQLKIPDPADLLNWVMIPFQAACDHAQSQPGPVPMILGAIRKKRAGGNTPPKAVWVSPTFCEQGGEPYEIVVNCRYVISINPDSMDRTVYQVFGRIRDQLMTDMGNHIHSYGQRPGYIKLPE